MERYSAERSRSGPLSLANPYPIKNQFVRVVEQTADLVFITNVNGIIEYVNPSFERTTGYSAAEVIGKTPNLLKSGKHDSMFYQNMWQTIFSGKAYHAEMINRKKDGSLFYSQKTITPLLNEKGQITHFVSTDKDITDKKEHENQLIEINRKLKLSNQELEQFAHVAAHDLQAPLRTICSFLDLIDKKAGFDPQTSKYFSFVVSATKKLSTMIQDLLSFSRVGVTRQLTESVDCAKTFKETLALLHTFIDECHARITYQNLPTIQGDPNLISLLFQNLLGNALKYRKDDPPQISFKAEKKDNFWLFSLSDNGIGIREADLSKLFVMFRRLHTESEYPGTGIGLAICKKIVESHGGNIWIESEFGKGTTFLFTLPFNE